MSITFDSPQSALPVDVDMDSPTTPTPTIRPTAETASFDPLSSPISPPLSFLDSDHFDDAWRAEMDPSNNDAAADLLLGASTSQRAYRDRLSTQQKLQEVVSLLQGRLQWSFQQLMIAWVSAQGDTNAAPTSYASTAFRRDAFRSLLQNTEFQAKAGLDNLQPPDIVSTIKDELSALVDSPYFGRLEGQETASVEDVNFPGAFEAIQSIAPTWHRLLRNLLQNERSHQSSAYKPERVEAHSLPRRMFMITAMVCHSRARNRSSYFHTLLTVYLQGSGTKRRVLDVLHGLGVCHSYQTSNRTLAGVAKQARKNLPVRAHHAQRVTAYDNMNFQDATRHETAGHKSEFRAVTTAVLVDSPELPPGGLDQTMHNPSIPLALSDILEAPGVAGDEHGPAISRGLITSAMRIVHAASLDLVFKDQPDAYPQIPTLERLSARKTEYWQVGGIMEDEGSLNGTYGVHENILLKQYKFEAPADPTTEQRDDFQRRLWLFHGDAATTKLIRSVKASQQQATRPYDRRDWLLGVPAWFHIQMNLLYTIVRTHWEGFGPHEQAAHCLKADATTWSRTQYGPDNIKYHLVEPMVTQSFAARVHALFFEAMRQRNLLLETETVAFLAESIDHNSAAVARLSVDEFNAIVEDVRLAAFTIEAWSGASSHNDIEFQTMCRMLQEIELFLLVRHAVKWGDIGHLRRLVDPLAIVFFGASQQNYGREMLYYRWLLSPVNSSALQHSILASGLVNWRGRKDTFKPIDLSLEHLNCACKNEMKCYKNSTKDATLIFDRICLTNTWMRGLRTKIERAFGVYMPNDHTTMAAVLDIVSLASTLRQNGLTVPRAPANLYGNFFESADILQHGIDVLAERVDAFNEQHVRLVDEFHIALPIDVPYDPLTSAEQGFVDIDDYVESLELELDSIDLTNT